MEGEKEKTQKKKERMRESLIRTSNAFFCAVLRALREQQNFFILLCFSEKKNPKTVINNGICLISAAWHLNDLLRLQF